jgi:hypothetical protein
MNVLKKITMAGAGMCLVALLTSSAGANAQGVGTDGFAAQGNIGSGETTGYVTGAQTQQAAGSVAPLLQGATNGTIAPQAGQETIVQG